MLTQRVGDENPDWASALKKKERRNGETGNILKDKKAVLAGLDSEAEDEEKLKGWQGPGWTGETG